MVCQNFRIGQVRSARNFPKNTKNFKSTKKTLSLVLQYSDSSSAKQMTSVNFEVFLACFSFHPKFFEKEISPFYCSVFFQNLLVSRTHPVADSVASCTKHKCGVIADRYPQQKTEHFFSRAGFLFPATFQHFRFFFSTLVFFPM